MASSMDKEKPDRVALATPAKTAIKASIADKAESRTERLSKMDDQLLSDNLLKEIDKKAAQERKRR
jgi:hypothetical protein